MLLEVISVISLSREQIFEQKPQYETLQDVTLSLPTSIYVMVMSLTYSKLYRKRGKLQAIQV